MQTANGVHINQFLRVIEITLLSSCMSHVLHVACSMNYHISALEGLCFVEIHAQGIS